jgi:hypothetical protein
MDANSHLSTSSVGIGKTPNLACTDDVPSTTIEVITHVESPRARRLNPAPVRHARDADQGIADSARPETNEVSGRPRPITPCLEGLAQWELA